MSCWDSFCSASAAATNDGTAMVLRLASVFGATSARRRPVRAHLADSGRACRGIGRSATFTVMVPAVRSTSGQRRPSASPSRRPVPTRSVQSRRNGDTTVSNLRTSVTVGKRTSWRLTVGASAYKAQSIVAGRALMRMTRDKRAQRAKRLKARKPYASPKYGIINLEAARVHTDLLGGPPVVGKLYRVGVTQGEKDNRVGFIGEYAGTGQDPYFPGEVAYRWIVRNPPLVRHHAERHGGEPVAHLAARPLAPVRGRAG